MLGNFGLYLGYFDSACVLLSPVEKADNFVVGCPPLSWVHIASWNQPWLV